MLKIAVRYIVKKWKSTFLMLAGVTISVVLMFSLIQMGDCIMAQLTQLLTNEIKDDFTITSIPYSKMLQTKKLLDDKNLKKNYVMTIKAGTCYDNKEPVNVVGMLGNVEYFNNIKLLKGKLPTKEYEICIERKYIDYTERALNIGTKVKLSIQCDSNDNEEKFEFVIVGIVEDVPHSELIFTNLETAEDIQKKLNCKELNNNEIAIAIDRKEHDSQKIAILCNEIEDKIKLNDFYIKHVRFNEEKDKLFNDETSEYTVFSRILKNCSFLIMICMILYVFDFCYLGMCQKMQDLAVMRCIGLSKNKQYSILVLETLVIGHLSVLLGCVFGTVLNYFVSEKIIGKLMLNYEGIPFQITIKSYLETYFCVMVSIVIALTKLILKMRKYTILDILRYTEKKYTKDIKKYKNILLNIANRNLRRNKAKSFLLFTTMSISILISLITFGIYDSIDLNISNSKNMTFDYEICMKNVLNSEVPIEGCKKLESLVGEKNLYKQYAYSLKSMTKNRNIAVVQYDNSLMNLILNNFKGLKDISANEPIALLYVSDSNSKCKEKEVRFSDGVREICIPVSRCIDTQDNYMIYSNFGYDFDIVVINEEMSKKLNMSTNKATGLLIKNNKYISLSEIRKCFAENAVPEITELKQEHSETEEQLLGVMAIASYILISTIVLSCGIIRSILKSNLIIRKEEYAIMRALGGTRIKIIHVCCLENVIVFVKAYVLSCCLSIPINLYLDTFLNNGYKWNAFLYVAVFIIYLLIIIIGNIIDAKKIFWSPIIVIMRKEQ